MTHPPDGGANAGTDRGIGPVPHGAQVHRLAPGLVRITASNPGLMTGPGTNSYVVGQGDLAVIDPGPDDRAHGQRLLDVAGALGTVRWILLTHTHVDHWPGTTWLAQQTGAVTVGFESRDGFVADRSAHDGWRLPEPGPPLVAVHTPGHAGNHLCWLEEDLGIVMTGDHIMHGSTVVIRPLDGDMSTYLASLDRLRKLRPQPDLIAPGHGRLITNVSATVGDLVAHRMARHCRVATVLIESGPTTVDQMLARVYSDVTPEQQVVARFSLWAHLRKLVEDGEAQVSGLSGEEQLEAVWSAVEPSSQEPR